MDPRRAAWLAAPSNAIYASAHHTRADWQCRVRGHIANLSHDVPRSTALPAPRPHTPAVRTAYPALAARSASRSRTHVTSAHHC